ncbi:MAG: hypothetical protein K940chlam7_01797 [Chlamydiae bacterium]|nr:hypothetical protein [Chlamydiota bacterium]
MSHSATISNLLAYLPSNFNQYIQTSRNIYHDLATWIHSNNPPGEVTTQSKVKISIEYLSKWVHHEKGWIFHSFKPIFECDAEELLSQKEKSKATWNKVFAIGTAMLASSASIYGIGESLAKAWETKQAIGSSLQPRAEWFPEFYIPPQTLNGFTAALVAYGMSVVSSHQSKMMPGILLTGVLSQLNPAIAQPFCPTFAGSYNTPTYAMEVVISGNYAYVANRDSGLWIIDVSNITNPTFIGSHSTPAYAEAVAVVGNYAYVAAFSSGLQIINVSNPSNPTLAGSYNTPDLAYGIAVLGNYAYVGDMSSGLQIVDISNPSNPTLTGTYNTPGWSFRIAVLGNYAYIADRSSGLQIIDVSNATNPIFSGSYKTPGDARGIAVLGNYAYVADYTSGLQIIDVSNVSNPRAVGSLSTLDNAVGITALDNYVYIAVEQAGLQIIDVRNATNPNSVDSFDTPNRALTVAVSNNYAYVADYTSGLQIINLACPTSTISSTTSTTRSSTSSTSISITSTLTTSSTSGSSTNITPSFSATSISRILTSKTQLSNSPNKPNYIAIGVGVVGGTGIVLLTYLLLKKHKKPIQAEGQEPEPVSRNTFYRKSLADKYAEERKKLQEEEDDEHEYQLTADVVHPAVPHYQHTPDVKRPEEME